MKKDKTKKEKIKYIDDGRTIADMSGVSNKRNNLSKRGTVSSPKEIWNTYWNAVKMMVRPMLVVIGFLCAIYLIITIIFWLI